MVIILRQLSLTTLFLTSAALAVPPAHAQSQAEKPRREHSLPRTAGGGYSMAKIYRAGLLAIPMRKKVWVVCDDVNLDPTDSSRLIPIGKGGASDAVMLCGDDGRGPDLMTEASFSDYQLHIEFNVPKGSNSGVYNRGLFEIQVFDSFGKEPIGFHDCGALYERAFPRENLAKPPGQWQTFDITLKGKRLSLIWNGKPVYQDQDVRYGETDRDAFERLNQENVTSTGAASRQASREERPLCRLLRRRRYASRIGWAGPSRSDPAPGRPWSRRLRNILIKPLNQDH